MLEGTTIATVTAVVLELAGIVAGALGSIAARRARRAAAGGPARAGREGPR